MYKKIIYSIAAAVILGIHATSSAYTYNNWQGPVYYGPGRVIVQYPNRYPNVYTPPGGVYGSWNSPYSHVNSPYSQVNSPYAGGVYNSWNQNQGGTPTRVIIIEGNPPYN